MKLPLNDNGGQNQWLWATIKINIRTLNQVTLQPNTLFKINIKI